MITDIAMSEYLDIQVKCDKYFHTTIIFFYTIRFKFCIKNLLNYWNFIEYQNEKAGEKAALCDT